MATGLPIGEKVTINVSSSWDGTITASEFYSAAVSLSEKWKMVEHSLPPWLWVSCRRSHLGLSPSQEEDGYLSLEKMCIFRSDKIDDSKVGVAGSKVPKYSENEELSDNAILVEESNHELYYYDFHIVYSNSYKVPMMYFRGYSSDGQPLMLHDVERDLPASSAKLLNEAKWTFITQQEHPHLNRPWFALHPCGTNELVRLLFMGDESLDKRRISTRHYLVSWLSVVGQVVGLRVPFQMI